MKTIPLLALLLAATPLTARANAPATANQDGASLEDHLKKLNYSMGLVKGLLSPEELAGMQKRYDETSSMSSKERTEALRAYLKPIIDRYLSIDILAPQASRRA